MVNSKAFSKVNSGEYTRFHSQDHKDLKFSSFLRKDKDYSVEPYRGVPLVDKRFEPKPEYSRLKFDPDVRSVADDFENHLVYRYMQGILPDQKPESSYVAVNHNGQVWHLFNAEKMPIGRLAAMAAVFIRGKNKPGFVLNKEDQGDKIVVVNASKIMITGKKKHQKLYRHYTGYVGNLKEIPFLELQEKNPREIIRRAIKGMIPKNSIRDDIVERNLIVHNGLYHNHYAQKLPHFVRQKPEDINKDYGINTITKEDYYVEFESNPANPPVEFKDFERRIDPEVGTPIPSMTKTHTEGSRPMQINRQLQKSFKSLRNFKKF
ncbi:50s ribosomal protein l13 [Stylonychia lemnae]|uniref:50s ribosomal protein l13 n=1 Tax=Stylonychia lemnae TaxID=5949 RepID=A0A078B6G3_STYLE|nr:50s ribosomal protein l13 [Stylonychia lemnae]|eukprot:CDW89811.1 50s ribosomal protein l13 [Stylonychia lemnae]